MYHINKINIPYKKVIINKNEKTVQIYQWCIKKHPLINSQIIYENLKKNNNL